jgi:TetR/AcrR family transcriptional regulator, fatty acid biosynthesis regulator
VPQRALTRGESKTITRTRLLAAGAKILAESGYGGLSVSAVARAAGVAQPTFYVHFRDKDELLRTLGTEQIGALRVKLREARLRVLEGQGVEAVRETFRVAVDTWIQHPALLQAFLREQYESSSPFGTMALELRADLVADMVEDFARLGLATEAPGGRERLAMIADAMIAQTECLARGYLDGRYTDREAVVDVLTQFAVGVLGLEEPASR